MAELLQNIGIGQALLLLGGLCVGGILLLVVLNLLGTVAGLAANLIDLASALVTGDPTAGCGCVVLLLGCGGCACVAVFVAAVLSTCGTERAVYFCSLFGR